MPIAYEDDYGPRGLLPGVQDRVMDMTWGSFASNAAAKLGRIGSEALHQAVVETPRAIRKGVETAFPALGMAYNLADAYTRQAPPGQAEVTETPWIERGRPTDPYERFAGQVLGDPLSYAPAAPAALKAGAEAFGPVIARAGEGYMERTGLMMGAAPKTPKLPDYRDIGGQNFKVKKSGHFVGAPPGVESDDAVSALADKYAANIERGLDSGVSPGWFYEKGAKAIKEVSDTPRTATMLSHANAITSSEAPVLSNAGWAIKGMEQEALGLPIATGKYPTEVGGTMRRAFDDPLTDLGEKRGPYGKGLQGERGGKAPNDRWEIRTFGYAGESASPTQHEFMHKVRQMAIDRVNQRRGLKLTPHEGQEINWAIVRADAMKITPEESMADSIHRALPEYSFQHSWESAPGSRAQHLPNLSDVYPDLFKYHERVKDVLIDPATGKDRLVAAMGGRLQLPSFDAPGVYEGAVSPGTQSRSLIYKTNEGGLDPTSRARVESTELTRGLMLGQNAVAGMTPLKAKSAGAADLLSVELGGPITEQQTRKMIHLLDNQMGPGNYSLVPTERGVGVLDLRTQAEGAPKLTPFNKLMKGIEKEIPGERSALGGRSTVYEELPWEQGGVTKRVLESYDAAPGLRALADSPETRGLMGETAQMYEAMRGAMPNDKIVTVLKAWASGGLAAVEDLVRKGLAPAVALTILGGALRPRDQSD